MNNINNEKNYNNVEKIIEENTALSSNIDTNNYTYNNDNTYKDASYNN